MTQEVAGLLMCMSVVTLIAGLVAWGMAIALVRDVCRRISELTRRNMLMAAADRSPTAAAMIVKSEITPRGDIPTASDIRVEMVPDIGEIGG